MSWMLVLAVVGSFLMIAVLPAYGLSHDLHSGDWKGLFPHKNVMGRQMAFAILMLTMVRPSSIPQWLRIGSLVGAAILLLKSHSATSLAATAICLAAFIVLHLLRVKKEKTLPLWVPFVPLATFAVLAVVANSDIFLRVLSKNETLTGRTAIWTTAIEAIHRQPWFGYGYLAFWQRSTTHAHDGYLDILLDIGIVGLALFSYVFVRTLLRALRLFVQTSGSDGKWPLVFLLFVAVYNITESCILRPRTFLWIPLVWVSIAMVPGLRPEENEGLELACAPDVPAVPEFST
jgi:O-antigen ligase